MGGHCYSSSDNNVTEVTRISYTFNTSSPSGTEFNVWMRNVADATWDGGERYVCSLDGVTGIGTLDFEFREGKPCLPR